MKVQVTRHILFKGTCTHLGQPADASFVVSFPESPSHRANVNDFCNRHIEYMGRTFTNYKLEQVVERATQRVTV